MFRFFNWSEEKKYSQLFVTHQPTQIWTLFGFKKCVHIFGCSLNQKCDPFSSHKEDLMMICTALGEEAINYSNDWLGAETDTYYLKYNTPSKNRSRGSKLNLEGKLILYGENVWSILHFLSINPFWVKLKIMKQVCDKVVKKSSVFLDCPLRYRYQYG